VYSLTLDLVDQLRPIADANDMDLVHLALAWVLKHRGATAAILGVRRPDQIENAVTMGDWELSDGDYAEINRLVKAYEVRKSELE
jgi:aryl-alcohol dehydrogenase-like predicted oxidoreductase